MYELIDKISNYCGCTKKTCCTTHSTVIGVGNSSILKFYQYIKVVYVLGKALSGELSFMQTGLVNMSI